MILHTEFLVHWTGKDFHLPPTNPIDDRIRRHYIARLADVLRNGFLMQRNVEESERMYGSDGTWIQGSIARTCFTEIKLSMAKRHAHEYGGLGIGVSREFVIERYGNPVFYVTNGAHSNINVCARTINAFLRATDEQILREFQIIFAYFKRMGDQNSDDLVYYNELEWRIVHLDRLESEGRLTVQDRTEHVYDESALAIYASRRRAFWKNQHCSALLGSSRNSALRTQSDRARVHICLRCGIPS